MEIKRVTGVDVNKALKLVWEVFLDFEAFGYNRKGVEEFRKFLDMKELIKTFTTFGAYKNGKLVGIISTQDYNQICLFFVKKEYQNRGIGKKLLNKVLEGVKDKGITIKVPVKSVGVFEGLGFEKNDEEHILNGINFVPMKYIGKKVKILKLDARGKKLELGKKTLIMGILNVTPDSFSDGGNYNSVEKAIQCAKKMIEDGVDIIDVGGESTRPGFTRISEEEEIERVVPVIRELSKLDILISIDTYKHKVARASIEAGANIINDIWGLQYDNGEMAKLIKEFDIPVIIMHNKDNKDYKKDIILEMKEFFCRSFSIAKENKLDMEKIIIDPGIGFGKGTKENLEVLGRLEELREIGRILLGASRKKFLGEISGEEVPQKRVAETLATTSLGIMKGVDIVRVHDVAENKKIALVLDRVIRK